MIILHYPTTSFASLSWIIYTPYYISRASPPCLSAFVGSTWAVVEVLLRKPWQRDRCSTIYAQNLMMLRKNPDFLIKEYSLRSNYIVKPMPTELKLETALLHSLFRSAHVDIYCLLSSSFIEHLLLLLFSACDVWNTACDAEERHQLCHQTNFTKWKTRFHY